MVPPSVSSTRSSPDPDLLLFNGPTFVNSARPSPPVPGFRPVPFTGVIYVMAEAAKKDVAVA